MATDCDTQNFIVEVHHDSRGVPGVSWAQNFTVTTSEVKVDLLQQHGILVNDVAVTLPYTQEQQVSIERSGDSILLNTAVGVKLVWNGDGYAELTVPGNYKRKMCGLCGNFNGFPQDDLRTQAGQITNSPAVFGNSWKAREQSGVVCADATDADPCVEAGYQVRRSATTTCEIIMGSSFSRCHRVVPVETYFSSCVYDLCACTNESRCLCDILQTYAKECAKAGVRLEWRTPGLCAMECDTASGFVFDECGPVCPRTCSNWQTALGQLSDNCYKPCVAGCQCSADKVVHNGQCIPTQDCPKIDSGAE